MATLTGHVLPSGAGKIEHTYVVSDHNDVWPCWGRSRAGSEICSGVGDAQIARCLAKPNSQAEIAYGITGVCYQTANRILWPAGTIVVSAKKYWVSWYLFGHYGRDRWRQLGTCAQSGGISIQPRFKGANVSITLSLEAQRWLAQDPPVDAERLSTADQDSIHRRFLMANYETSDGPDYTSREHERRVRRSEFKARVEAVFGANYDERKIAKVLELQEALHDSHDDLIADRESGELDADQYLERVNDLTATSLLKSSEILEPELFEKFFGFPSNQIKDMVEGLIDREIFQIAHSK